MDDLRTGTRSEIAVLATETLDAAACQLEAMHLEEATAYALVSIAASLYLASTRPTR
jgi:hypothetical protein